MVPHPDTVFSLRLDTNEMVERERFANLLSAIEIAVRNDGFAGRGAILVIGGVRQGSVELLIGIAGLAVAVASVALAVPGFLLSLRQLSRDKDQDPNTFAVAIGEVMGMDGVIRADFRHKDMLVSISRDEVPFARRMQLAAPRAESASAIEVESETDEPVPRNLQIGVEDEDQDWLPTLEASEAPPRDATGAPSGYMNSLAMSGEFERIETAKGDTRLRFVPRESLLAPFFDVTSNNYQESPEENVEYEVIGNVTLDGDQPATIEILYIGRPDDEFAPLRT